MMLSAKLESGKMFLWGWDRGSRGLGGVSELEEDVSRSLKLSARGG